MSRVCLLNSLLAVGLLLMIGSCGDDSASGSEGESSSTAPTGSASESTTMGGSASETGSTTMGGSASNSDTGTSTSTATDGSATSNGTTTMATTDGETDSESGVTMGAATSTTGDMTTGGVTGDTTGSTGSTGSTGTGSTTGDDENSKWLVSFEDTSSPTRLYKIDLIDGHSTFLCALDTNDNYNTSSFGRSGSLYAANASTKNLETIDPCTCERTIIGPTKVSTLPGITADQGLGLYGLETSIDMLVDISTENGNATPIGPLGIDWGTGGLTWSDELKDTYAINGTDDTLYTIDHLTGKAELLAKTDYDFGSVGIEWHPKTTRIYACSNSAELLQVDEIDGKVSVLGPMNLENNAAHCDNLAAPWTPIQCVEDAG